MKKTALILSALMLALLQGCGGGGDSDAPASPEQPSPVTPDEPPALTIDNDGNVSAPFTRTDFSRYMLISPRASDFGLLTDVAQADSGALLRLNVTRFSDSSATREIAGDASYALGRWVQGTVTDLTGTQTLPGSDDRSYHYAAYNIPARFPATGDYLCAPQIATLPTRASGTGVDTGFLGTGLCFSAGGEVEAKWGCPYDRTRFEFNDAGAHFLSGHWMYVTADHESVLVLMPDLIASPDSLATSGEFLDGGTGAAVQITDAGDGNYAIVMAYAAKFESGALYHGVARMSCTAFPLNPANTSAAASP